MVKSSVLSKYDVSSLVRMVSASTPADAELVNNAKSKFRNLRDVCQVYGMSEVGCLCSEERSTKGTKPGSAGQPSPGSIMKVVDQNTREPLGPNQRGEICIKSPALMQGYLHSSNRDHMDSEGFMLTGDIGYYDEDAYFYIVNRIKELIKFNSFQVAPAELESVLQQHPQVREAGVVGAPHEKYGQAPLAFVALQPGATITEKELVAYVDTQVSARMRLEGGVRFVDALPRGAGAKLDRKALKLMI
ncbi:luciferin 4-monooxygenase-like [Choristoneura fumiferana]|uniref:luciferin 4-monooxygenase-like n=1 Tax=Choristoneura fumiferana TaxID=7141 RepID=UPI003D15831B